MSEYPTIPISATAIQGVPIDVPAGAAYVATFNSGTGHVVWAPTQSVGVQDVQADSPLSAGSDPAHPEISIASPIPVTLGGTSIDTSGLTGRPKLAAGVPSVAAINLATEVTGTLPVANGGTGSATQNFVDLTTPQTVGGAKTFSSTIVGNISGNAGTATTAMTANAVAANGVTAAALNANSFRFLGAVGLAAAGAVTLTGAKVSDTVIGVVGTVSGTVTSLFESTITVNNQIQMTSGSIAAEKIFVLLIAKGG